MDNRIQIIIEAYDRAQKAFDKLHGYFRTAVKDGESFRLKASEIERQIGTLASAAVLYKLKGFLSDAIDEAESMKNSLRGLASVARYAGEDIGESMRRVQAYAKDGLVDVGNASKALQNLLQRGFKLDEAMTILERLKDAAAFNRQSTMSMSDAVRSATEGLKNEMSMMVDNAGVTKNVAIMWKEYAGQIGKGVNQLTMAEKRQAEYNGILRETEAQMGNAKLAAQGLTGAKARLAVESKNLKIALGDSLTPAFLELTKWGKSFLKEVVIPMIGGIEILSTKMAQYAAKVAVRTEIREVRGAPRWELSEEDKQRRLAQLEQQLKDLDKNTSDQIDDIVAKWTNKLKLPDIGKDPGKRRRDTDTGGDGDDKGQKKLKDAWQATLRDLELDIKNAPLEDVFEQKANEIAAKAAELQEKFKNVPGAVEAIAAWRDAMTEAATKGAQEDALKNDYELKRDATQKILALSQSLTEANQTEAQKRIAQAEAEADERRIVAVESYEAGAIDYQTYADTIVNIDQAKADAIKKINAEALNAQREAQIQLQLSEIDLAEKTGDISAEEALRRRIALTGELLRIQEAFGASIDRANDPTGWILQQEAINRTRAALVGLRDEAQKYSGDFAGGWKQALDRYVQDADTAFEHGKTLAEETARSMESAFSNFFFDALEGKLQSFGDYVESFLRSVAQAMSNIMAQKAAVGIVDVFFGGGTTSGGSSAVDLFSQGDYFTVDQSLKLQTKHGGGEVGSPQTFYRVVPVIDTAMIPRRHSGGLAPDERLTVNRVGERYVTEEQNEWLTAIARKAAESGSSPQAPTQVKVEIVNQSGEKLQASNAKASFNARELIVTVWLDALNRNAYGLRDAIGG